MTLHARGVVVSRLNDARLTHKHAAASFLQDKEIEK